MVKKLVVKKLKSVAKDSQLSATIRDSAQQIWLAGLGAFSKAQEEGGKVFEALVKEGLTIQRKTQAVAEEKITEATSRVTTMASDIGSKAQGQWDKLEQVFEDRVSRSLNRLGVLSSRDVEDLARQVAELNQSVRDLMGGAAPKAARKAPAKKKATRKRKAAAK